MATYYLQARWDYDSRPTFELAAAHYAGSKDAKHGRAATAAVFEFEKASPLNDEGFQKVHTGFFRSADLWGPSVKEFLERHGVK